MSIHKYKDWSGWIDGLRTVALQAGAEAIVTNLTTMLGSNGVASMIPALHDYALGWHTALLTTATQAILRTVLAAAKYVQDKPDAAIIEVEGNTEVFVKSPEPAANQQPESKQ